MLHSTNKQRQKVKCDLFPIICVASDKKVPYMFYQPYCGKLLYIAVCIPKYFAEEEIQRYKKKLHEG